MEAPQIEVELPSMRAANAQAATNQPVSAWQTLMKPPDAFGGIRSAAKQRQAAQMRRLEKNFQTTQRVEEALRARKTYQEVRDLVRKSGAVCTVHKKVVKNNANIDETNNNPLVLATCDDDDDGDVDINVSYRQQANLEMYSSVNMKARDENKRHPEVAKAINEFWNVLPKTDNGNVNKNIYKWFNRKLYFTLVPKATDDEFEKTVEEDWKNDAVFSHVMNAVAFKNAIFNLADLWCETVDPREYRDFLHRCRRVVEAPPHYTGSLDENHRELRRKTIVGIMGPKEGTKVRLARRPSAVPPQNTPPGTPENHSFGTRGPASAQQSPRDGDLLSTLNDGEEGELDDSVEAIKKGAEAIEDEINEFRILSWYNTLGELREFHAADAEDNEDNLYQILRDVQDKRFDVFEDDKDPSFKVEADLMAEAREEMAARMKERNALAEEKQKLTRKSSSSSSMSKDLEKMKQERAKKAQSLSEKKDEHISKLLGKQFSANERYAHAYEMISSLERSRFDEMLNRLHDNDSILRSVLNCMKADVYRQNQARIDHDEDNFQEYTMFTKDIQTLRKTIEVQIADGMTDHVHKEFFESEDPELDDAREIKFGNIYYKRAIEWLRNFHSRMNSALEDMLSNSMDYVKRLKYKDTQYLHALHRAEMEMETSQIGAYGSDELIPSGMKLKAMEDLQKVKEEATKERKTQTATMQGRHGAWDQALEDLMTKAILRSDSESAEFAKLEQCKKLDDVFEISEPTLDLYAEVGFVHEMQETMAMGMAPPSKGGLPKDIESALQVVMWRLEQYKKFVTKYLVQFVEIRHKIWHQRSAEYHSAEQAHAALMHSTNLRALKERHTVLKKFTDILADPKQSKDYSESQVKVMAEMINDLGNLKKQVGEMDGTLEFYNDSLDRVCKLGQQRSLARAQRFVKLTLAEIGEFERLDELEIARVAQHEAWMQRFTENWSEVERAQRIAEAQNRDRRQKEKERIRREQEAAEQKRKDLEEERLRRLQQDEKDREALAEARRQKEKAIAETRRRQLEERERKQKERERREAEEKKKWREQYLKEEKARKKEAEERRYAERQRVQSKGNLKRKGTTPPPGETTSKGPLPPVNTKKATGRPTPGATPSQTPKARERKATLPQLGRNQYGGEISETTQRAMASQKKVRTIGAPSNRIKAAIEEEIKSFSKLNTTSLAVNLENYNDRRQDYFLERASNAAIYAMECTRLRCPIAPAVSTKLSNEELDFSMTALDLSKKQCNVLSLLDLILLNPLQRLSLAGVKGFDKDACKKICQTLSVHEFIQILDVSGNPDVGAHGGQALLALVKGNTKIVKIKCDGSNIPAEVVSEIKEQLKKNEFSHTIGRAEFTYIQSVFKAIDKDGSGDVTLNELREYNKIHHSELGLKQETSELFKSVGGPGGNGDLPSSMMNSSGPGSPTKTAQQMQDRQNTRVQMVRDTLLALDKEGNDNFTLVDLMCFIYSTWKREDIVRLVKQYSDDSNTGASIDEMQQFVDQFGTNGTLTLHQLAKGLGEGDVESLRAAFNECDVDGDGFLSIDEFMSFVGA